MDINNPVALNATIQGLHEQMKSQSARSRQLLAALSRQLRDREAQLQKLRLLKDAQLQHIITQLLQLQGRLTADKKLVAKELHQKDKIISNLKDETYELKEVNRKLQAEVEKCSTTQCQETSIDSSDYDTNSPPQQKSKPSLKPKPTLPPKPVQQHDRKTEKKILKSGFKSGVNKNVNRVRFNLDHDYRYDSDSSEITELDTQRPISILDTISKLLDSDKNCSDQITPKLNSNDMLDSSLDSLNSTPPIDEENEVIDVVDVLQVPERLEVPPKITDLPIIKCSQTDILLVDKTVAKKTAVSELINGAATHREYSASDSELLDERPVPKQRKNKPHNKSKTTDDQPLPKVKKTRNRSRNDILKEVSDNMVRQNFEEFKLEIVEEDDSRNSVSEDSMNSENKRRDGDGAESPTEQSPFESDYRKLFYFNGSYDKFLEATGLSQKSLSSQRLFGNHRSVLRPKDVKNRHKLRSSSLNSSSSEDDITVKYWTEPYI